MPSLAQSSADVFTNQLLVLATVVGAVAALPALIEFILDSRKRRERIALSLEDEPTPSQPIALAGFDDIFRDIADLVDRAAHPGAYADLRLGNELLILGPPLSGKKSLARRVAQLAGVERIITVHNPRNADALAKAKSMLRRTHRANPPKLMLLLPGIDEVFDNDDRDEDIEAELDALVEAVASSDNILVVGTASRLAEGDDLDNLFGMKVVLPGAAPITKRAQRPDGPYSAVLSATAQHFLDLSSRAGCPLAGLTTPQAVERILAHVGNPAEVEDIVAAARTTAIFLRRTGQADALHITSPVLDKAIRRVMGHAHTPA